MITVARIHTHTYTNTYSEENETISLSKMLAICQDFFEKKKKVSSGKNQIKRTTRNVLI